MPDSGPGLVSRIIQIFGELAIMLAMLACLITGGGIFGSYNPPQTFGEIFPNISAVIRGVRQLFKGAWNEFYSACERFR